MLTYDRLFDTFEQFYFYQWFFLIVEISFQDNALMIYYCCCNFSLMFFISSRIQSIFYLLCKIYFKKCQSILTLANGQFKDMNLNIRDQQILSMQPQQTKPENSLDKTIKVQDRQEVQHFEQSSEEGSDNYVDQYDEEIDNILQQKQEKVSRQETILKFKNTQLQKICHTLTSANKKLLEKVEELQEELQSKNFSQISQTGMSEQYSEMNIEFTDVQTMISQYREQLKKYEQKMAKQYQQKNKKINELQSSLQQVKMTLSDSQFLNEELQNQVQALQFKNEDLLIQIQDISTKNEVQSRYNTPIQQYKQYGRGNNAYYQQNQYGSNFNSTVQSELQKLIQKLVKQLEFERGTKRKITQEMRRMRQELMDSEKQIAVKNQKIYMLEMQILKGANKSNLLRFNKNQTPTQQIKLKNSRQNVLRNNQTDKNANSRTNIIRQRARNQTSQANIVENANSAKNILLTEKKQKQKQKIPVSLKHNKLTKSNVAQINTNNYGIANEVNEQNKSKRILKSFSLLDLLNLEVKLSIVDKFIVSIKLIDFFTRKVNNKDFQTLMLQDIIVCNFNTINTNLILIRKNTINAAQRSSNSKYNASEDSAQSTLWNLGFILENILIQGSKPEDDLGNNNTELQIVKYVTDLFQNMKISIEVLVKLKELFQTAIKQRRQQHQK